MELLELSLAPAQMVCSKSSSRSSSSLESESRSSRKRKLFQDHMNTHPSSVQASVELQLRDPLPLDWEQCLDLESGEMFYMNRKTARKSWSWPKDMELDLNLELNISTLSPSFSAQRFSRSSKKVNGNATNKHEFVAGSNNMVALPCLNCHLLVMLSKSSPSCPNCKYVHSLPTSNQPLKISTSPCTPSTH